MQETATVTKEDLVKEGLLCNRIVSLIEDEYPAMRRKFEEGEGHGFFPLSPERHEEEKAIVNSIQKLKKGLIKKLNQDGNENFDLDHPITLREATGKHYHGIIEGIIRDIEGRLAPLLGNLNSVWRSPKRVKELYGTKAVAWLAREIFLHLAGVHLKARRREGQIKPTIKAVEQILRAHDFEVSINRKPEIEAVILQLSEMAVYQQLMRYYPKPRSEAMWADIDKHRNDSCRL